MFAVLVVLQYIIRPHAESGGASLLERSPREAAIEAQETVFGVNNPHGMRCRTKPFGRPGIIDQRRLDPLGRRDGEDARHDPGAHPRQQVTEGGQRARVGILEGALDHVEGEEADAIFGDGPDDERGAAFVQRPCALVAEYVGDDEERVARPGRGACVAELDSGFGELERVGYCCFDSARDAAGDERHGRRGLGIVRRS